MVNNKYFSNFENFNSYLKNLNFSYLNILSINIRSISSINKFNRFKTQLSSFHQLPNLIVIQETWFNSKIVQIYNIPGYRCVHCCRNYGFGGTSIYVRENFQFTVEVCESRHYCDTIAISLNNYKIKGTPIKFISFYRSQKCSIDTFSHIIENIINSYGRSPCVIVGDSNIDFLESNASMDFSNLLSHYYFKKLS